jgi:hypothetical protein
MRIEGSCIAKHSPAVQGSAESHAWVHWMLHGACRSPLQQVLAIWPSKKTSVRLSGENVASPFLLFPTAELHCLECSAARNGDLLLVLDFHFRTEGRFCKCFATPHLFTCTSFILPNALVSCPLALNTRHFILYCRMKCYACLFCPSCSSALQNKSCCRHQSSYFCIMFACFPHDANLVLLQLGTLPQSSPALSLWPQFLCTDGSLTHFPLSPVSAELLRPSLPCFCRVFPDCVSSEDTLSSLLLLSEQKVQFFLVNYLYLMICACTFICNSLYYGGLS